MSHSQEKLDGMNCYFVFLPLKQYCMGRNISDMVTMDFGPRYAIWYHPFQAAYIDSNVLYWPPKYPAGTHQGCNNVYIRDRIEYLCNM